jgi:hypothetical protein
MGLVQSVITNMNNNIPIEIENPEEMDEDKVVVEIKEPRGPDDWVRMDIGYGIDSRYEVHDMYTTVQRLGLEDWIKNYNGEEYQRYSDEINKISDGLEDNNHSGASFSGCLWRTKEVYQNGWYPKYNVHINTN